MKYIVVLITILLTIGNIVLGQTLVGKDVLTNQLFAPWRETGTTNYNTGIPAGYLIANKIGIKPYFGWNFRCSSWGDSVSVLDTNGMAGGYVTFSYKSSKKGTVAWWLRGDNNGTAKGLQGWLTASTFQADTIWKVVQIPWNTLNTVKGTVNTLQIQNNNPDTNGVNAWIMDIRFVPRLAAGFTMPAPPHIIRWFGNASDTIRETYWGIFKVWDTSKLLFAATWLNNKRICVAPYDPSYTDTVLDWTNMPENLLGGDRICKDTLIVVVSLTTDALPTGKYTIWLQVGNVNGVSYKLPQDINVINNGTGSFNAGFQIGYDSGSHSVICPPTVCPPFPDTTAIKLKAFNDGKTSVVCPPTTPIDSSANRKPRLPVIRIK